MKLTPKQRAFADYYIELGNATEAAKRAGYSHKTARQMGTENLSKPSIKSYIEKRLEEIENERIADAKEVMQYLTSVMRGEAIEEIVGFTEYGAERVRKLPYVKDRVKAAELLGKRYAMWTDKHEIDGAVGVQIIDDLGSDEEDES